MKRLFSSCAIGFVILLGLLPAKPGRAAAAPAMTIQAADAPRHANEEAIVCGLVASVKYAAQTRGQPTFLDFEKPYPGEVFRVVIWGSDRGKFDDPPESAYGQKKVCVTGRIKLYRGTPEIIVRDPAQLTVRTAAAARGTGRGSRVPSRGDGKKC